MVTNGHNYRRHVEDDAADPDGQKACLCASTRHERVKTHISVHICCECCGPELICTGFSSDVFNYCVKSGRNQLCNKVVIASSESHNDVKMFDLVEFFQVVTILAPLTSTMLLTISSCPTNEDK